MEYLLDQKIITLSVMLFGFLCGLGLSYLLRIGTRSSSKKRFDDYAKFSMDTDDFTAKILQESEDRRFEFDVIKEATEAFREYSESEPLFIDGKWQKIGRIILANPCRSFYIIHHEPTAKYTNADFSKMVREKYLEFKNQYDKDNGIDIQSSLQ